MKPQWKIIVPLAALGLVQAFMRVNKVGESVPFLAGAVWIAVVATWAAVVTNKKVSNPFDTHLITGALSGLFSALLQQAYWTTFWADVAATGELTADVMNPAVRAMAFASSVLMGVMWGAVAGLVAAAIGRRDAKKKPASLDLAE